MKRGIKAVIFDIGGVLELEEKMKKPLRGHFLGVHEFIVKKLNISLDQYFDSIDTAYAKSIEGGITEKEAVLIMSKNLKITSKKLRSLYAKAYKKKFKRNIKLYKLAFKLKKKGYKIALLSDQWYVSKKALMPKRLTKKFDVVVVSCDVGVRKPDPKIYKLISKKLGLKPKQILFIDNQEWNLLPAKKLGMQTILFKDNEQLFKALEKIGIKLK